MEDDILEEKHDLLVMMTTVQTTISQFGEFIDEGAQGTMNMNLFCTLLCELLYCNNILFHQPSKQNRILIILKQIHDTVGNIASSTVMPDDAPAYYNAWSSVTTSTHNHFVHVLRFKRLEMGTKCRNKK